MKDFLKKIGIVKNEEEEQVVQTKTTTSFNNNSFPVPEKVVTEQTFARETKIESPFIDLNEHKKHQETVFSKKDETNPYLEQLRKIYADGFTKLNQPGTDFYEVFQALNKIGNLESGEGLKMALAMCSDPLTKEVLYSQADQYTKQLVERYELVKKQGQDSWDKLKADKESLTLALDEDIAEYERLLAEAKSKRNGVKEKYAPLFGENLAKQEANSIAYSELMDKISKVQNNIKNNL